jgi:hypothetical protein
MIEMFLFFALGALLQICSYGSMMEPSLAGYIPLLTLLVIALLLDLIMRHPSYFREDASPWGFCEWIFKSHRIGIPIQHSGRAGKFALPIQIWKRMISRKR